MRKTKRCDASQLRTKPVYVIVKCILERGHDDDHLDANYGRWKKEA